MNTAGPASDGVTPLLNGEQFLQPLSRAAEAIAYSVERNWPIDPRLTAEQNFEIPATVAALIRTSLTYFRAGWFLIADQTRDAVGWRPEFILSLSLSARTAIEILFNLLFILEEPSKRVPAFNHHGWREAALDFELYRDEYLAEGGHKAEWARGLQLHLDMGRSIFGITPDQASNPRSISPWPNPGTMWHHGYGEKTPTDELPSQRQLMKLLYFTDYKPLSGEAHANGWGQLRIGGLVMLHAMSREAREHAYNQVYPKLLGKGVGLLTLCLLCMTCELQHHLGVTDVDLEARIAAIWAELCKVEAYREHFERRYKAWYPYVIFSGSIER